MGNLISWLANRNGSPGPCVYELTIYSGKTNTGQQECEKEQNKFNFTCNTQFYINYINCGCQYTGIDDSCNIKK